MAGIRTGRDLFAWQTFAGAAFGFLICAFLVYPPRCGWGDNKWGDVATWASALGTFLAAAVALWIALRDGRRQERRDQMKGLIVMSHLAGEMMTAHQAVYIARRGFDIAVSSTSIRDASDYIARGAQELRSIKLPKTLAIGDRLADLSPRLAMILAAIHDQISLAYSEIEEELSQPLPAGNAVDEFCRKFSEAFEQVDAIEKNLLEFLSAFEFALAKK